MVKANKHRCFHAVSSVVKVFSESYVASFSYGIPLLLAPLPLAFTSQDFTFAVTVLPISLQASLLPLKLVLCVVRTIFSVLFPVLFLLCSECRLLSCNRTVMSAAWSSYCFLLNHSVSSAQMTVYLSLRYCNPISHA